MAARAPSGFLVSALNKVDLPTLGRPTIPMLNVATAGFYRPRSAPEPAAIVPCGVSARDLSDPCGMVNP